MTVEKGEFFIVEARFGNEEKALEVNELAMNSFHVDGVEEFSIDEATVDEILGERAYSGGDVPLSVIDEVEVEAKVRNELIYKYYFFNGDLKRAEDFVAYIEENHQEVAVTAEKQEFSDWNEEWKKHYAPIVVTENLSVIPEWYKEEGHKSNRDNIYINPGMGFGTGEHETTFLCLKLFESVKSEIKEGGLCLDFGCGSGILGIGAIKKLKMQVDFIDIDPAALDNCLTNLKLNFEDSELNGIVLAHRDRFEVTEKYELVFANILEHVLILEKETLLSSLKEGSFLILSGILNDQVPNIREEYKMLTHIETVSKGDWSAIVFKK
ncbi:50S ribosomal protein L11 methyltransferase [Bacteriovorax sp. Seq25_V]|uniref:50S ribosomal protein L11 methyltransferase n=1 Tax=Bacteriovorax sp. Seq25_V TaxID=1201288 RepID=UPI00038A25E9|nr:50S ribosomal protein L11 methyltransferase [Bacteriovorax sp. Seq25_V]EQC43249.1 ribosomal protein L11 methyltransferase [Bacteriovorax sp. Seq25_V]